MLHLILPQLFEFTCEKKGALFTLNTFFRLLYIVPVKKAQSFELIYDILERQITSDLCSIIQKSVDSVYLLISHVMKRNGRVTTTFKTLFASKKIKCI